MKSSTQVKLSIPVSNSILWLWFYTMEPQAISILVNMGLQYSVALGSDVGSSSNL